MSEDKDGERIFRADGQDQQEESGDEDGKRTFSCVGS